MEYDELVKNLAIKNSMSFEKLSWKKSVVENLILKPASR